MVPTVSLRERRLTPGTLLNPGGCWSTWDLVLDGVHKLGWTTVWWGPQDWSGPQCDEDHKTGVDHLRVLKPWGCWNLEGVNHLGNWKTGTQKKENSWKSCTLDTLKFRICELRKLLKSTLTFESKIWNGKISIFILFSWRKVERFLSSFLHVMLVSLIDQFQSII